LNSQQVVCPSLQVLAGRFFIPPHLPQGLPASPLPSGERAGVRGFFLNCPLGAIKREGGENVNGCVVCCSRNMRACLIIRR